MESKILKKLLIVMLIVTLTATDFLMLGTSIVSYAASLDILTNNKNIEFSAYFKNAEGERISTAEENINKEDLKLYAEISVKNEGYFNGTIEILESNFNIKNEILSTGISKIEGNKITLNQINAGNTVEIELAIDPIKSEEMEIGQLTKTSKVKLTGTYMETTYKGKDIEAEKAVNLNLKLDEENTTAEISNEIVTNKIYNVNGTNKRIVQMLVKSKITNNNYPVKQTVLTATIPEAQKEKLESVKITALRTKATNGQENNATTEEWKAETGEGINSIQTTIENNGEKIKWQKGTEDEFIITYTYNEETEVNGIELKVNTEIEVYNTETKFSKEATATVSNEELGNIVVSEINIDQTETYKGQLYANVKAENKKEIPFSSTTKMVVRMAGVAETITIQEAKDIFTGAELEANTRYIKTYINKERMLAILGEEGYIEVKTAETTYRLTKDSETDENGNIVIGYGAEIREIQITTSTPINVGTLEINHEKAIMANNYTTEQIKTISGLRRINKTTIQSSINKETAEEGATAKTETVISENASQVEKELKETYSKAELTVNKANLSTMATNNEVSLGVKLITNGTQYDLYKNPTIKIQLPKEVKGINVTSINKLYGEEFAISKAVYNKADKTIEIALSGEQTAYAENEVKQLYLQINLDITLEQTAVSKTEKIAMAFTNENASQYEGNGIIEKEIGIVAPSGLIAINDINTYNINTVAGISEDKQKADLSKDTAAGTSAEFQISLVNNTGNNISDVKILGNFPTEGEIQQGEEKITNTLETTVEKAINAGNATVYYSENSEATANIEDATNGWTQDTSKIANAKTYLIDLGDMEAEESFTTTYTSKLASTLDYDLVSYAGYEVSYNEEGSTQTVESTLVGMSTEEGVELEDIKMETKIEATVGNDTLKDGDTVKAGEVIKYKVTAKNVGERKLKDVVLKGGVPEGTVVVVPEEDYLHSGLSYYEEKTEMKEVSETIASLEAGQEYTIEYEVRVNMNITNGSQISNKATVTCGEYALESNEMKVTLSEAKVRVTLKKLSDQDITKFFVGEYIGYEVFVENLSDETINNLNLQLNIVGAEIDYLADSDGNETTKTNNIQISELTPNGKVGYVFRIKITEGATNQFSTNAIVKDTKGIEYRANNFEISIYEGNAEITLTSPNDGDYVDIGDEIRYDFIIENTEDIIEVVKLYDEISEYLEVQEIIYDGEIVMQKNNYQDEDTYVRKIANEVNYATVLQPNETAEMSVIAKVKNINEQFDTKTITNSAQIKVNDEVKDTSEEVTHIIKGNISEDMKNIISGVAWLDSNQNGQKDSEESVLSDITVRLLDTKTNKLATDKEGKTLETKTNQEGTYTFSKVNKGEYIVIFEYDTTKYEPTTYMKEGVSTGLNSKAVEKTVTIDGQVKGNAATDIINLTESVFNINIGLKENLKYDLELGKYISKIVVQNKKGTKTYEYEDETFKKVEIHSKQIEGSVVVLEYTIKVKNTGEIAGYVTNIRDYLPSGLTFSSELNPEWYLSGEDLYTKSLANTRIEPGETKEIKLTLTKTMTANNVGLINNRVEIAETYNEYGKLDIDSTVNNQANGEDDMGAADVIIGVSTGMKVIAYVMLMIINTGLIALAIYLIFKKNHRTK